MGKIIRPLVGYTQQKTSKKELELYHTLVILVLNLQNYNAKVIITGL